MITLYDTRQPHPAALDAPDPGDARRPRAAQRAERDVRRGDGVLAGHQARGRSATGLRTFDTTFFQAPGPDERVRRAPVQGDPRLRPQRARGAARWPTWRSGSTSTGRRIVVLAGPGDRRDEDLRAIAARGRRALRPLHLPARRQPARPRRRDEVPRILRDGAAGATACRREQISIIPDEQEAIDAALQHGPARRPAADLRRRADALLEADHQVPSRGRARSRRRRGAPRRRPRSLSEPASKPPPLASLEGLLRDERGIRLAPEVDD